MRRLRMKILASDFDGTLKRQGRIEPQDLNAIQRFRRHGHQFGIVTGRSIAMLMCEAGPLQIPFDFVIGNNGGIVVDQQLRVLHRFDLARQDWEALIRFLRRVAELPGYQPDAVGFFNPWSWHTRQPGLTGAILAPSDEMTRAAVRELIAEVEEQSTPRTIAFDTEFFPAEEFARIHAPDLNADFLPEE